SPGYIYRVAQVFANNGAGVRGDLGAVVRAILMDYEARSAAVASTVTCGKMKEPLLRATAILRAFNGAANLGRYNIPNPEGNLAQAALRAPTVLISSSRITCCRARWRRPDCMRPSIRFSRTRRR